MTDFELQMKLMFIALIGTVAFLAITVLQGCIPLVEVNMVSRSTLSDGETVRTSQHDVTVDEDEASMELIVPLK